MVPFHSTLNFLKRPDGSCEVTKGGTRIWCGVNGPGDIQSSKRIFDKVNILFDINRLSATNKHLEITKSKSTNLSASTETPSKLIESVVRAAVDLAAYPRATLQVSVQEIKCDGPSDSTLINGICLALLDAGIQMHFPFAALTVIKRPLVDDNATFFVKREAGTNFEFIVEPTQSQAAKTTATFCFVLRPSVLAQGGCALLASDAHGRFTLQDFKQARTIAQSQCLGVFDLYRQKISEKFARDLIRE